MYCQKRFKITYGVVQKILHQQLLQGYPFVEYLEVELSVKNSSFNHKTYYGYNNGLRQFGNKMFWQIDNLLMGQEYDIVYFMISIPIKFGNVFKPLDVDKLYQKIISALIP